MQEYVLRKFPSCSSLCSICKHGCKHHPCCTNGQSERKEVLLRHDSSLELYNLLQGKNSVSVDTSYDPRYPISPFCHNGFQNFQNYTLTVNNAPKNKACLCKPIGTFDFNAPKEEMKEETKPTKNTPQKKEKKKCCPLFKKKKKQDKRDAGTNIGGEEGKSAAAIAGGGEAAEDNANREIRIILCSGTCESSTATNTVATQSSTSTAFNTKSVRIQEAPSKTSNNCPPECDMLYKNASGKVASSQDFGGGPDADFQLKSKRVTQDETSQVPVRDARIKRACKCSDKSLQASLKDMLASSITQTSLVNDDSNTKSSKMTFGRKQNMGVGTGRKCNCQEQVEMLKMLIKMEAKQNYRLIGNIMKELSYQRDEMRRLTDLYEDAILNGGFSGSKRREDIFGSDICIGEAKCTKCRKCRAKADSKNVKDMLNHSMKSDSFDLSDKSENRKTGGLSMFNMYSQEFIEQVITNDKSMKNCSKAVFCVQDVVQKKESSKELEETVKVSMSDSDRLCPTSVCKSITCVPNEPEPNVEEKETISSSCPVLKKLFDFLSECVIFSHLV